MKAHEVYHHKKQIYIILELCDGGDLYNRLPYSEMDAAYISGKLLSAIKYMHDHGIVHRDCKFISPLLCVHALMSESEMSDSLYLQ